MEWEIYERNFRNKAVDYTVLEADILLSYAKNLFQKGFPIIYDKYHLSLLVGYELMYIDRACKSTERFYRIFKIPKKNGGFREIAEPLPSLKEIQTWIYINILQKASISRYSKAYVKGNSIKSNAKFHRDKDIVLTIDIANYFTSIRVDKIKAYFSSIGYNKEVSEILSKLCCLNGSLPQGAPTSPALSNIVTKEIDDKISMVTIPLKINYSRYADDLTFSGILSVGFVVTKVREILVEEGFNINDKKIRAQSRHQQQLVTGVVVNKKLQVERTKRRKLRQIMYYINIYGFEDHCKRIGIKKKNYIEHLIGTANYILFINPKDTETSSYLKKLHDLRRELAL